VFFNLTGQPQPLPARAPGKLLFSSEAGCYQGARTPRDPAGELLPWECVSFGPDGWEASGS
jgi:hypothetical protein